VDFSASGFAITEERKESINFSKPYYTGGTKIVVPATMVPGTVPSEKNSFIAKTVESFEKTFLREDRWKMFVEGSFNTLVITLFSILFGTLLGFLVYLLCRSRGIIVNKVTSWFTWLLQGMPVVVLLMILYYIVFGKISIGGMVVSIIGFTLVFGVSVLGILKTGVSAVDNGQTEAACALGCTPRQAFFHIILPQALPFMTDPYKGEIIGLVKATSIVGYIAVLDLTKMGDLVRSRTYEAFFPLIAVMVIYFILEGILGFCVSIIAKKVNPRKKNN
jgi:polar amino acid transport system substrate-binding protein